MHVTPEHAIVNLSVGTCLAQRLEPLHFLCAFDGAVNVLMLLSADAAAYLKQRVLSLEAELATLKWHADSIGLSASGTVASAALAYAPGVAPATVPPLILLLERPLASTILTSLPPALAADPAPTEMTEHCLVATGMQH